MTNVVPEIAIRVRPEALHRYTHAAFLKVGLSDEDAARLAAALLACDLRGVFSHGSRQVASYTRLFRDGKLNPRPELKIVRDTPTAVQVDGDGGLGYFPSFRAVEMAIEKAKQQGMAVGMTYNHNHFGAAGLYTRQAVEAGCFGFAVSSHFRRFEPEQSVLWASGGSPMSFGIPAGDQPPLVLDMGTYGVKATGENVRDYAPVNFKMLGLGLFCHALAGVLAGMVSVEEESALGKWEAVNQGAFFLVVDLAPLTDPKAFRSQMEAFIGAVRQMRPAPGYERADIPGSLEWERAQEWAREGVPVGPEHQKSIERVCRELELPLPW